MTRKYAADIGKFPSLRAKSKCRNLTIPDAWEQVRFPNMPEQHSPGNHTVAGLQPRRRYLMRACGSLRLVVVRHMPAPAAPAAGLQRELLFRLKGANSARSAFRSPLAHLLRRFRPHHLNLDSPSFGDQPPSAAISQKSIVLMGLFYVCQIGNCCTTWSSEYPRNADSRQPLP